MGAMSIWHWLVVLLIVVLLFGRGKIPDLMADVAKGIKSFKKGMSDDEPAKTDAPPPKTIDNKGAPTVEQTTQQGTKTG